MIPFSICVSVLLAPIPEKLTKLVKEPEITVLLEFDSTQPSGLKRPFVCNLETPMLLVHIIKSNKFRLKCFKTVLA